jgi:hypothetical protein
MSNLVSLFFLAAWGKALKLAEVLLGSCLDKVASPDFLSRLCAGIENGTSLFRFWI